MLSRNIPLAAVLWNGGISFGGVIAFIFADQIVIPLKTGGPEMLRMMNRPARAGHAH